MNPSYRDIVDRIPESPSWWDEGGVPRYGDFSPERSPNIYATEVVLMEIACQSCDEIFKVCFASRRRSERDKSLAEDIRNGHLDYGDPPNTGCCAAGASMNSVPTKILEYWSKGHPRYVENGIVIDHVRHSEWRRDPLLEGKYKGWDA